MHPSLLPDYQHLHSHAQRLLQCADALSHSVSKVEDSYWEHMAEQCIETLLLSDESSIIEQLFQYLNEHQLTEHLEIIASLLEGCSESISLEDAQGQRYDALLISIPITAWTRYSLPEGPMDSELTHALEQQLHQHVLAPKVRVALHPELLCFEDVPHNLHQARQLLESLAKQALGLHGKSTTKLPPRSQHPTLLADARFVLAVIAAPSGLPLFAWQQSKERALTKQVAILNTWQQHSQELFAGLFTGCQTEYWLPNAFHANNRVAEQHLRPLNLKATVTWLQTVAQVPKGQLTAILAACGQEQIEEYRIGFCVTDSDVVIHGCIWPLLDPDDQSDTLAQISELLKELDSGDVLLLP
ncbi:DUF2863 family protein, partial [Alcaligenaceae bacterium 429]